MLATDARKLYRPIHDDRISRQIAKGHQLARRRRYQERKTDLGKERARLIKAKEIRGLGGPCECGRNHHGIQINGSEMCPIRLYLIVQQLRDEPRFARWLQYWKLERGEFSQGYLLSPLTEGDCTYSQEVADTFGDFDRQAMKRLTKEAYENTQHKAL